jgi:hypothetical protein
MGQCALLILLIALGLATPANGRAYFPSRLWQLWAGLIFCSLIWCDRVAFWNFQQACQIVMPLMFGTLAAWCVRSEEQVKSLVRHFIYSLIPLILVIAGTRMIRTDETGNRDAAMTVALVGCVLLSGINRSLVYSYLSWAACIALIIFSQSRMAAVALLLLVIAHPLYKSVWHRLLAVVVLTACGLTVFYSPTFQHRTFYSGSGTLQDLFAGNGVDTSGRQEAWPLIYDEALKQPVFGHGVGTSKAFVYSIWTPVTHPHNDYLRIFFELGLVGLALFVITVLVQLYDLACMVKITDGAIQQAFSASILGILFFLIVAATDNPLVYNLWYTDPLFVLMGAAYGAHCARKEEAVT